MPTNYVCIKEVPKTSVGKFDKKEIRRLFTEDKLAYVVRKGQTVNDFSQAAALSSENSLIYPLE